MSLVDSDFEQAGFDEEGFDQPGGQEGAAQPDPPAAPNYRKQGFSIYSVMLILSFVFLVTAIVLLFMEIDKLS